MVWHVHSRVSNDKLVWLLTLSWVFFFSLFTVYVDSVRFQFRLIDRIKLICSSNFFSRLSNQLMIQLWMVEMTFEWFVTVEKCSYSFQSSIAYKIGVESAACVKWNELAALKVNNAKVHGNGMNKHYFVTTIISFNLIDFQNDCPYFSNYLPRFFFWYWNLFVLMIELACSER